MSPRNKALWVASVTSVLTLLLYAVGDVPVYPSRALPVIWAFFSWNFYAFGHEKDMWPWVFVELDGQGKGQPLAREIMFWITAVLYVCLLSTIAWGK
jgi:hypothetical protein